MSFVSLALVLAAVISWIVYRRHRRGPSVPGISTWQLLSGQVVVDPPNLHRQLAEWGRKFNGVWSFGNYIVVDDKDIALDVLLHRDTLFAGRIEEGHFPSYEFFYKSKDILTRSYSPELKLYRKVAFKALHHYGEGVHDFEQIVHDDLRELIDRLRDTEERAIDPTESVQGCIVSIITSLLFGERFKQSSEEVKQVRKLNDGVLALTDVGSCPEILMNPFARLLLMLPFERYRVIRRRLDTAIQLRTEFSILANKYKGQPGGGQSAYASLLSEQAILGQQTLTDDNITAILLDLVVAGIVTTSATLRGLLYTAASLPDVQHRVYTELQHITGGSRLVQLADREQATYTRAVVQEQLRLQTPAGFGAFHVTTEDVKLNGYSLPKGTPILVSFWKVLRDRRFWKEPEDFYPEHFLSEDGSIKSPAGMKDRGYLPFGAGKRSCIGENLARSRLFLMFGALVQSFHILPPSDEKLPKPGNETFKLKGTVEPAPFELRFVPRE